MRGDVSRGGVRAALATAQTLATATKPQESSYGVPAQGGRAKEQQTESIFYPEHCGQPIEYYFYPNSSVPVFCPTTEQFADFEALVAAIEPLSLRAGVCKIMPPRKWRRQLEASGGSGSGSGSGDPRVFADEQFPIVKPIVQHFNGSSGIFHQYNVEFHRKVRLAQFFQTSQDASHRVPEAKAAGGGAARDDDDDDDDNDNDNGEEEDVYRSETMGIAVDYGSGRMRLTSCAAEALRQGIRSEGARARFRPATAEYSPQPDIEGEPAAEHNGVQPLRRFTADDGRALFVSAREYAANEEMERMYWKNLLFQPPMYGADVLGTLYPEPEDFPTWNIRRLPGLLQKVERSMPGVNDPYLYLGMWKATFAWHVEDMDLYSINYIHFGAPKAWYSIPIEARGRFEMSMQNVFANDYKTCSQFLRHKAFLLSPRFLASQGIPFNRVVQRAGEIMLTFPLGYHAGFNHGFNCAESVNFALDRWLAIARESKHCECVKDSVTIDLMEWFGAGQRDPSAAAAAAAEQAPEDAVDRDGERAVKRASPRRHAAAAAAIAKSAEKPAKPEASPAAKRPPGRPRKTEAAAAAAASSPSVAGAKKRKAAAVADACKDGEGSGDGKERRAKRLAASATTAQTQKQDRSQPTHMHDVQTPMSGSERTDGQMDDEVRRRFASLHTPVGTCGACLLRIMELEDSSDGADPSPSMFVECQQCGLTVHPQCSALSYDDGNYKCANCVMDTDQLSCALCAFQNGLLLPVAGKQPHCEPGDSRAALSRASPRFVHFLCAHFIDELYFDFAGRPSQSLAKSPSGSVGGDDDDDDGEPDKMVTRSRSSRRHNAKAGGSSGNDGLAVKNSARVCGLEKVSKSRYAAKCVFCHGCCVGAAVQCAHPRCFRAFHPMCAATKQPSLLDWSLGKIYCPAHHAGAAASSTKASAKTAATPAVVKNSGQKKK